MQCDDISLRTFLTKAEIRLLADRSEEQPSPNCLRKIKNVDGIHLDENECNIPWTRGERILHIELQRRETDCHPTAVCKFIPEGVAELCDNLLLLRR